MLEKLKINQIIDIEVEEGNEHAGNYRTRIEDINEDSIVIAMPIVQGNLVPLRPDTPVIIWYWDSIATFAFYCQVKARFFEPLPMVFLSRPFSIKKIQRREHVRVPTSLKIEYSFVNKSNLDGVYHSTFLRDLSGGGAQFITNKSLSKGTELKVKIYLPSEVIECQAKVRWSKEEIIDNQSRFFVGVQFINISERDREEIIKYVFFRQRELIKKGVL